MFSPLLNSIKERHGYALVNEENHKNITTNEDFSVLLFAGDASRLAESDDVAVVLPELEKVFDNVFTPLIVERDSERKLQQLYRFNAFPSLVFLRRGEFLGTIQQIQDWGDYVTQISEILLREPSDPPPFQFPDGCGAPVPEHVKSGLPN